MTTFTTSDINSFARDIQLNLQSRTIVEEELHEYQPRDACILCKRFIPSSAYGDMLEKYIKARFGWSTATDETSGDAVTRTKKHVEIKVTMTSKTGEWNFSQLRPSHLVDFYIGMLYDINNDRVYFVAVPHDDMNRIILENCNSYAHGTKKEKGELTESSLLDPDNEFSLWFQVTTGKESKLTKKQKVWNDISHFLISEEELKEL